ncbi:hypothetical protein QBC32DRAFT_146426 [Pseudoneurospora amorphoporcata]|uniref:Uncharacterized protein n=1 Tax=Pseudoneurospora amorphoporcata TaxID=241081 RepID=A0AAN6NWB9_9PEZI|nr:hypothetical protein QBC32DRAFT_146426 [Pseudoneurospora amorphoporcata]
MTERNAIQKSNPQSYSQSDHSQAQGEVNELESPPPSYEAAVIGRGDRNHDLNEPAGAFHSLNQQQRHQQQLERQRQQLDQQLEQQRQQRELQRQQLGQQLEEQRHQQQQQQRQQQPYPIQEYSSSNYHYTPDAKHPNTSQHNDYYDVEAQQATVAGGSGIHSAISGQGQTDAREGRRHRRGGCQKEGGKQRSGNCCVACFGGCLAGCACCYCCVVM